MVAALALGMVRGDDLPAMLRAAIGASGAAVLAPVAGEIDPVVVRRFAGLAQVAAR